MECCRSPGFDRDSRIGTATKPVPSLLLKMPQLRPSGMRRFPALRTRINKLRQALQMQLGLISQWGQSRFDGSWGGVCCLPRPFWSRG